MRVIHVLRKPLSEGTVAANTLKHGCGGLNIDVSRISTGDNLNGGAYAENPTERWDGAENWRYKRGDHGNVGEYQQPTGRWPANVILQHLDGCRCDGIKRVKANTSVRDSRGKAHSKYRFQGEGTVRTDTHVGFADKDGKESVAHWICEPGCPVRALDEQSGSAGGWYNADTTTKGRSGAATLFGNANDGGLRNGYNDTGGASRFYKQVGGKADE